MSETQGRPTKYTPEMVATICERIADGEVSIYGLHDPRDGSLRYIGKANDPAKRFKSHMKDSRTRTTPVYAWIRKLAALGLVPDLRVIRVCAPDEWARAEASEIAAARLRGERLANLADGGDEPFCPPDVRAANGALVAKLRVSTEAAARVYRLKRDVGRLLKQGSVSARNLAKLRYAAQRAPHLFGSFAGV